MGHYWTFFCNPKRWKIDEFIASDEIETFYQIMDHQKDDFRPGQLGVVRVGHDTRNKQQRNGRPRLNRGIYAFVEIISPPATGKNIPDKYTYSQEAPKQDRLRLTVDVRFLKDLLPIPLYLSDLESDDLIRADKYLLSGFLASSMPLQKESFDRIMAIAKAKHQ